MKRIILTTIITVAVAMAANATQTIRELWDNVFTTGTDRPINQVNDGTTSRGFQPGVNWYLNHSSPLMQNAQNFNVDGPGLPNNGGKNAAIWPQCFLARTNYTNLGFIDDGVYGPTMDPQHWGVRQLATNAQINFNANGIYYFSMKIGHGGNSSVGLGFATGTNASSRFVGAGYTWTSYLTQRLTNQDTSVVNLGNTLVITSGTLDQTDPGMIDPIGYPIMGPCYVRTYDTNGLGTYAGSGTLLGRLTTSVGGNTTLEAARIPTGTAMPTSENDVVWSVSYSFNDTNVMTHFMFWQNSFYNTWPYGDCDAIRVGDRFIDVAGLENINVTANPAATNYQGTMVIIAATNAATAEAPSYQWRKEGINLSDIPNVRSNTAGTVTGVGLSNTRLFLFNPVPADSGNYDVVISNVFGVATSAVVYVSIQPPSAPIPPLDNPKPATRFVHGYHTFTLDGLAGTPPYTFQWRLAGTNLPGATNQTFTRADILTSLAGNYDCVIGGGNSSATSIVATLTVVPLPAGSYTEAVMNQQPFAYWPLDETGTNVTHDFAGGHNGGIGVLYDGVDFLPTEQGLPGLRNKPFPGFSSNNTAMGVTNAYDNQLDGGVIVLPVTNMTIMGWVYPRGNQGVNDGLFLARYQTDTANLCGLYCAGQNALGQNTISFWWNGLGGTEPTLLGVTNVFLPTNQWSFVVMSVNPTNISLYVGYGGTLYESDHNALTDGAMGSVNDATPLGPYVNEWPLAFGCDTIPWAHREDRNFDGYIDSVALFGKTLTTAQIEAIYQAGAGTAVRLYATPAGGGDSTLSWINGLLQSSATVEGPYTNVDGALGPYYTIPNSEPMQFFRAMVTTNGTIVQ